MLGTILVVMNSSPDFMNRFGGEVQVLWFFPPQVLPPQPAPLVPIDDQ